MYLLNVSYNQAPRNVEPHVSRHAVWVRQHFSDGTFLLAGPKKSSLGGVILAKSMLRSELQRLLAEDPYVKAEVVDYQIVDFDCKLARSGLDTLSRA